MKNGSDKKWEIWHKSITITCLFHLYVKRTLYSATFLLHICMVDWDFFFTNSSVTNGTEHSVYLYILWTLFCKGLLYHNKLFHLCRNTGMFTVLKFMLMWLATVTATLHTLLSKYNIRFFLPADISWKLDCSLYWSIFNSDGILLKALSKNVFIHWNCFIFFRMDIIQKYDCGQEVWVKCIP